MRGDNNIRDYFLEPRLNKEHKSQEYTSITEIMDSGKVLVDLSMYKFETVEVDGLTQNVFNDYLSYITDNPENTQYITFDANAAVRFEFKPWSICKWLYGNSELYYILYALNDIEHDSDFSHDFLMSHPLRVITGPGLAALQKVLDFKQRIETSDGAASFYINEM